MQRMKKSDFYYHLPPELIAQHPLPDRPASRLMMVDRSRNTIQDAHFFQLPDFLRAGDVLVFNNTRVIPARLHAHKPTGGQVEVFVERLLGPRSAKVMLKASKAPRLGSELLFAAGSATCKARLVARCGMFWLLQWQTHGTLTAYMRRYGNTPLPPYIQRQPSDEDSERYQTVYSQHEGAVAAPTAGLHFDERLLQRLKDKGVEQCFVTLHVGAGTFQPVKDDDISQHKMHKEWVEVPAETCRLINQARAEGRRIVAVGTTSVRSLEAAACASGDFAKNGLQPLTGDTDIFIYPGYRFQVVDGLLTNFHLPESTLLMLVSAFAGKTLIDTAYRHAVEQRYRFFSYGDAMLLV